MRSIVQRLESLQRAGVTHVKKAPQAIVPPHAEEAGAKRRLAPQASDPAATAVVRGRKAPAAESLQDDKEARLAELEAVAREVAVCTRCAELAATRTQTVFGVGNPCSRLVFCGEAPGADEDRLGEPFVGRAGQLLNDIITKGMKMRREDVYILNILRCRPPGNRAPLPAEAAACRPFLDRQLAIIKPEFICCLGAVAAQNLLGTEETIGRLRGRVHDYHGIKVICTYHPAYLLRNPQAKRPVWEDVQMLLAEIGKAEKR